MKALYARLSFKMNGQLFGLWLIFSAFVNMKLNEVPNSHRALQKVHGSQQGRIEQSGPQIYLGLMNEIWASLGFDEAIFFNISPYFWAFSWLYYAIL